METTWDMSPAKRKMFIVAASFPSFVRARGTLLVAGFSCFSLDPQSAAFRKRGAGVDAVKMKDHHSSPRLSLVSRNRTQPRLLPLFLVSYQPLARCGFSAGQAGLIRPSAGVSGVRPERPDAVRTGRLRASNGLQH